MKKNEENEILKHGESLSNLLMKIIDFYHDEYKPDHFGEVAFISALTVMGALLLDSPEEEHELRANGIHKKLLETIKQCKEERKNDF